MVQIFSQFDDVLKTFKVGSIVRGVYTNDNKERFCFIQKTKDGYIDSITRKPIELKQFPRIDYIRTRTCILKIGRAHV